MAPVVTPCNTSSTKAQREVYNWTCVLLLGCTAILPYVLSLPYYVLNGLFHYFVIKSSAIYIYYITINGVVDGGMSYIFCISFWSWAVLV